ncbi:hypothetical protein Q9L58_008700 [Maublancomyces gigas]|uniref:Uncharacterized protein n=1 Tax=Discina gigas TaxID=1032678 RepID=A0ABR3G8Y2_9PEZI
MIPVDREQLAPETEEQLDRPVSDSEVEKPRKRRTGIWKLNRTFEERLGKRRRGLNPGFDYQDLLNRHQKPKFPNDIHSTDNDWAADESQVFDPVARADRRTTRVGRPSMGRSKGDGKGKGVKKGSEREVKRNAASDAEQDGRDEDEEDVQDNDDDEDLV